MIALQAGYQEEYYQTNIWFWVKKANTIVVSVTEELASLLQAGSLYSHP
jgi:hypothetical protein